MYRVIRKAHKRAGRRFKAALDAGVAVDGRAPETKLWGEAERLLERLEWAQKRARFDEYQMRDREEVEA